jgi:hypothetical protein
MDSVITTTGYKICSFLPPWEGLSLTPKKRYKEIFSIYCNPINIGNLFLDAYLASMNSEWHVVDGDEVEVLVEEFTD